MENTIDAMAEPPLYLRECTAFRHAATFEQKVQELVDREELRELIACYAHRIAHSRSVADLFTADGVYVQIVPGQPYKETVGRAAIAQLYAGWTPEAPDSPKPMIHNAMLEIDGDTATGICSNEVRMTRDGESLIGSAYYDDRFRREEGGWRFAARRSTFFHMVPLRQGWASPAQPGR